MDQTVKQDKTSATTGKPAASKQGKKSAKTGKMIAKTGKPEIKKVEELEKELKILRLTFKDAVQQFSMRVDSHILQLGERCAKDQDEKNRQFLKKHASACIKKLKKIKLKPKKGRLKDLIAVYELVEKFSDL